MGNKKRKLCLCLSLLLWHLATAEGEEEQPCSEKSPTVVSEVTYGNNGDTRYLAKWALQPACKGNHHVYWAGPDGTLGAGFTVDYGEEMRADGFFLRNSHNYIYRDRYTLLRS